MKSFLLSSLVLALAFLSFGCTQNSTPKDQIVVGLRAAGMSLDPHVVNDAASFRLIENMYDRLFRYTENYGEVEPHLVEKYSFSKDGKLLRLKIREDVVFHDGSQMTSEDVLFSLQRIINSKVRAEHFAGIDTIKPTGRFSVELKFVEPNAAILTNLAHPMNAIVSKEITNRHKGKLGKTDAGSGPFKLKEWKQGFHLELVRHDQYFLEDQPAVQSLVYRPISQEGTRMVALKNGEVDIVYDVPPKSIQEVIENENLSYAQKPGTFWEYVGLNVKNKKLKDTRVRQAIAYAIDRDQLNRVIKQGAATALGGSPLPKSHWAANTDYRPYSERNLEKAKSLLKEAGQSKGFDLEMVLKADSPEQIEAAQIVKANLKEIGINLSLKPLESTIYFERLGKKNFESTLIGWVGFVDPDEWFYHIFHSSGKWNQQGYANSEVDQLLEKARIETSQAKRAELYKKVQRIIVEESPLVFLYLNPLSSAWNYHLEDVLIHPTATTTFLSRAHWADQ